MSSRQRDMIALVAQTRSNSTGKLNVMSGEEIKCAPANQRQAAEPGANQPEREDWKALCSG